MTEIEKKLWRRVEMFCDVLHMVPFLRMVGVCNNLAFSRVDEKSDIDLFIIASKGRLFFVRTLDTVLFHILGVRRHGDKVAGRFCLSFFVDDCSLGLEPLSIEDDLYLAYWIYSMVVIIDNGVSDDFFNENKWVRSYFENDVVLGSFRLVSSNIFLNFIRSLLFNIFSGKFGRFIESFLSYWQIRRSLRKRSLLADDSGIVISEHILKFHNVDRRVFYRDLWRRKFGDKNLTPDLFADLYS